MDTVADIILILSVIGLIAGLIKPGIFHKLTNGTHPKRKIGLVFGTGIVIGLILLAAFAPATPAKKTADKTTTNTKATTKPAVSTVSPAERTAKAVSTLQAGTDFYSQLFKQGQTALGTTQYPNAQAALADENNPSSPAAKWAKFNSTLTSTDYTMPHITQPYNNASNLYSDSAPAAIGNWNADMQQVDTDLHEWARQATNWLDSEITTAQLNTYTQTFQKDLTAAHNDVNQLK